MQRYRSVTKWIAAALVLAVLLSLVLIAGSLRPSDNAEPLPQRALKLSAEAGPSPSGGGTAELPLTDATETTGESTPPAETEPPKETEAPEKPKASAETEAPEATEPTSPAGEETSGNGNAEESTAQPSDGSGDEAHNGGEGENGNGGGEGTPEDDTSLRIVTDLTDCVLTYEELTDDILPFYAYIVNGASDMYLRVKLRNSQTPANGSFLTASGRDYRAALARQESNFITLYIKQGSKTVLEETYTVRYIARKAGEDSPTVGEQPPTVTTNLDGFTGQLTNRNFTFLVKARAYDGSILFADHILVTLDGKPVRDPTGSDVFEYELYFENPTVGDTETHEVTVLAWDDAGNSTYLRYEVTYSFVDTGGKVGTAYILLDATVVGLDPETLGGTYVYEIKQNEPASYAVLAMLEEFGYEADYARSPDDGFYLRRIARSGMTDYAEIPDALWQKILDDGLGLTGQSDADSLGEFDYTQGAGWMYSINGTLYAGKGLSNYYLSDGDTLYIRFTLAYGKDIGGYNAGGGSYGRLPTYCGRWINGTYYDEHSWGEETILQEATCTESGSMARTCAVCGDMQETAALPPLGHDFAETARQEPTETEEGWIDYTCTRCGATERKTLPPLETGTDAITNRRKKREETML